jgi:hypothetical protein
MQEHADRLMAWEVVHTTLATGKKLQPSLIAKSIGLPTTDIYAMLDVSHARHLL